MVVGFVALATPVCRLRSRLSAARGEGGASIFLWPTHHVVWVKGFWWLILCHGNAYKTNCVNHHYQCSHTRCGDQGNLWHRTVELQCSVFNTPIEASLGYYNRYVDENTCPGCPVSDSKRTKTHLALENSITCFRLSICVINHTYRT